MNLQQYIDKLQQLIDNDPSLAEAEVWAAADDEGNSYSPVDTRGSIYYAPLETGYYEESLVAGYNVETDILEQEDVYRDDFDNDAEYQEACNEVLANYKRVVVIN